MEHGEDYLKTRVTILETQLSEYRRRTVELEEEVNHLKNAIKERETYLHLHNRRF